GEHAFTISSRPFFAGSSPLARGTRRLSVMNDQGVRFIPAGAGNTIPDRCESSGFPVHPRWRGEHERKGPVTPGLCGSSPLARGTPRRVVKPQPDFRFIPAGAGNTKVYNGW